MWSIALLENTVKINKKTAQDLFKESEETGEEIWYELKSVAPKGKLTFNSDHMEHMDFLTNDDLLDVLLRNKVNGRICFGSLDGDQVGEFWGYEFDGKGGVSNLQGEITWKSKEIEEEEEEDFEEND